MAITEQMSQAFKSNADLEICTPFANSIHAIPTPSSFDNVLTPYDCDSVITYPKCLILRCVFVVSYDALCGPCCYFEETPERLTTGCQSPLSVILFFLTLGTVIAVLRSEKGRQAFKSNADLEICTPFANSIHAIPTPSSFDNVLTPYDCDSVITYPKCLILRAQEPSTGYIETCHRSAHN
ncbi:hypothetical protein JOQ06_008158 [Pogonophryne albipinna]|uniref:Uncharacterized protein n=1 Tax=Pogonophryne albipinna TaxID=1090488 RepID=A0AAD6AJI4_9TELE|nr:hypothetical protein JOQ06_008158 [Pogonophryne albipinna]